MKPTTNGSSKTDITSQESLTINRRALLQAVGLGTAVGLAGCQGIDTSVVGQSTDEHVPFDVWNELQTAVRTSSDHLPARAEQLVEDGDPEAIFEFVRDEIATYPPEINHLYGTRDVIRWGVRGTLRGGAGTPREKAELLASLYRQAGFTAEILINPRLVEDPENEEAAVQHLLWRPVDRRFDPDIDETQLAEWNERLDLSSEPQSDIVPIDTDGRESTTLGQSLFEGLPDERRAPQAFSWGWYGTPVVRVVIDGEDRYANLFTPELPFGDAGISPGRLDDAPEATDPLPVDVTLSAATAATPDEPFEIVSGKWGLDELVGRQLLVQTLPGIDPLERPDATFRDIQTFIPALTVQAMDLDTESMTALSVTGDALTRAGDRLQGHDDGTLTRNGEPLVVPDSTTTGADVAELNVTADSSRYPEIRLNMHALDANGDPVDGLPATAFEVVDEDQGVGVSLTANQKAPRVLILSDESSSMPSEYYGDEMEDLVVTLRERIIAEYPNAQITHEFRRDDLWTQGDRAAGTDANIVVYITDGRVTDEPTEEIEGTLRQGPPIIFLAVEPDDPWIPSDMNHIATLSGGAVEPAGDHSVASATIMDSIADQISSLPNYVLTYGSPASTDASGERQVSLRIADGDAEGSDTYVIPDTAALPPHLAGLYLTLTVNEREITRTLAGYDPVQHLDQPITQAMIDEVAGALFGSHTLSFEAAAPPFSVWFDDLLTAKLSVAGLDQAIQADDQEALDREREQGFTFIPPELFVLSGPLPDAITDRSLTFQHGPRVTLYQERPVFGTNTAIRHADLFPFAEFATAATDSEEAFQLTLEKTARLAIIENVLFESSTESKLEGKRLGEFSGADDSFRTEWSDERSKMWDHLFYEHDEYDGYNLVAADGTPSAFWNIDQETGELLGVLGDGSGGGSSAERIREQIEQIDRAISLYNLWLIGAGPAGLLTPWGAFAVGVVAAYGQTLARLYGAAALAITVMDTSDLDEQSRAAIASLACNVARSIVFTVLDNWLIDAIDNILGVAGASNPTSCPG